MDIVIALKESDVPLFVKAMRQLGENVYIDEEMMITEIRRGGEFNVIDPSGLKIDFFLMKDDEFTKQQNIRKRPTMIGDQQIFFVSPEDLILSKLIWAKKSGSDRQLDDVRSVSEMMSEQLDWEYLNRWAKELGVDGLLNSL